MVALSAADYGSRQSYYRYLFVIGAIWNIVIALGFLFLPNVALNLFQLQVPTISVWFQLFFALDRVKARNNCRQCGASFVRLSAEGLCETWPLSTNRLTVLRKVYWAVSAMRRISLRASTIAAMGVSMSRSPKLGNR